MFFWKKKLPFILLAAFVLLSSGCLHKEETVPPKPEPSDETLKQVEQLNLLADELYRKVSAGDIVEARNKLHQLGVQMTAIRFEGIASIEGAHALSEAIVQAERVLNALKFSFEDGQIAAAKIRLATDALTHSNQPMWLQYERILQADVSKLEKAVKANHAQEAVLLLEQIRIHYSVVRPSVLISRSPSDAEMLDSLLTFLQSQLIDGKMQSAEILSGIEHLRGALEGVFYKKHSAAYLPLIDTRQPLYWTMVIGSFIIVVLAFAGWRLYRYEQVYPFKRK